MAVNQEHSCEKVASRCERCRGNGYFQRGSLVTPCPECSGKGRLIVSPSDGEGK